jgi:hypothetical protein
VIGPERSRGNGGTVRPRSSVGGRAPNPPPPSGSGGPRISVVVAAHTRVQFLKRAVASAASQGPDEVVVVKYARDAELDGELTALGATVRVTSEPYQGGKIAEGIEHATGDAVVLLDDDDVLLPGKIPRMREIFGDPRVVFCSNRYVPFTDTPPDHGEAGPVQLFKTGEGNQFRRGLKPVLTSCVTLRREMVVPWLADLRQLTIADHTIFMMAVAARRWMAVDQSILTGYHVSQVDGALRPVQSIWLRPGASARRDITWMLDFLDSQTDGVRETLTPVVAAAVIHLVFLTGETEFTEYRRTMRAILHGVGVRRPLTVPSTLMFGYPLSPKLAIGLNRVWKSLVGYHHHQG